MISGLHQSEVVLNDHDVPHAEGWVEPPGGVRHHEQTHANQAHRPHGHNNCSKKIFTHCIIKNQFGKIKYVS